MYPAHTSFGRIRRFLRFSRLIESITYAFQPPFQLACVFKSLQIAPPAASINMLRVFIRLQIHTKCRGVTLSGLPPCVLCVLCALCVKFFHSSFFDLDVNTTRPPLPRDRPPLSPHIFTRPTNIPA